MSNPIRTKILRTLSRVKGKSLNEITTKVQETEPDTSKRQVARRLLALEAEGRAEREGETKATRWTKVYNRTKAA